MSRELPTQHTTEEDFQHFLSYSGLRLKMPQFIEELRMAYFHGARVPYSRSPDALRNTDKP